MDKTNLKEAFCLRPLDERIAEGIALLDTYAREANTAFTMQSQHLTGVEAIKAQLAHMAMLDQYALDFNIPARRLMRNDAEQVVFDKIRLNCADGLPQRHTTALKNILKEHDWIRISVFGEEADGHAWLIVQHADHDHDFQQDVLNRLERLYPQGETSPQHYAYLHDRVQTRGFFHQGPRGLQRFGTQGHYVNQHWQPFPCEAAEHLDERRKSVGLTPMAEYRKAFSTLQI